MKHKKKMSSTGEQHHLQVNDRRTYDGGHPLGVLLDFGIDSWFSGSSTANSPTHHTSELIPAAREAGQRTSRVPLRHRRPCDKDSDRMRGEDHEIRRDKDKVMKFSWILSG